MSKLKTHMHSYTLTDSQLGFYHENGYLHLKGVWSEDEVDILRRDADEYADTLAKDIDFVKALMIKEGKLQAALAQVRERKKKIQQRILKNI